MPDEVVRVLDVLDDDTLAVMGEPDVLEGVLELDVVGVEDVLPVLRWIDVVLL